MPTDAAPAPQALPWGAAPVAETYFPRGGGMAFLLGGMLKKDLTPWLYIGAKAVAGPVFNTSPWGGVGYMGPRIGLDLKLPADFELAGDLLAGVSAGFGPEAISGVSSLLIPNYMVFLPYFGGYRLGIGGGYLIAPNMTGMNGQYFSFGVTL